MAATSTIPTGAALQELAGIIPDTIRVCPRRDLDAIELDVAGCAVLLTLPAAMRLALVVGELALAMEDRR